MDLSSRRTFTACKARTLRREHMASKIGRLINHSAEARGTSPIQWVLPQRSQLALWSK